MEGKKEVCTLRYSDFSAHIKNIEFSVWMDSCHISIAKLNALFDQNGKNSIKKFRVAVFSYGAHLGVYSTLNLDASNIPQETGILDKK